MKNNMITGLAAILIIAATAFAQQDSAEAKQRGDGHEPKGCSDATLRGDYGRLITGVRVIGGQSESFVGTALRTYDGEGGFVEVANSHGQITGTERNLPKTGVYHVNPDCTGTATMFIPNFPPVETSFVIVDRGREINHAVMSPLPQLATAIERRVFLND
jgi:hypothetical protein